MEDRSEELLLEWKNRLGLQDWRILLCPKCSEDEMSIEDAAGATSWQETNKTARIEILDPADYGERVEPMGTGAGSRASASETVPALRQRQRPDGQDRTYPHRRPRPRLRRRQALRR